MYFVTHTLKCICVCVCVYYYSLIWLFATLRYNYRFVPFELINERRNKNIVAVLPTHWKLENNGEPNNKRATKHTKIKQYGRIPFACYNHHSRQIHMDRDKISPDGYYMHTDERATYIYLLNALNWMKPTSRFHIHILWKWRAWSEISMNT